MKRAFLISLIAALFVCLVAAYLGARAHAAPLEIAGELWVAEPQRPVCERVEWVQKPWAELRFSCGAIACAGEWDGSKWLYSCRVYSGYSEAEARRVIAGGGESLYDHEARHILQRLSHPERRQHVAK